MSTDMKEAPKPPAVKGWVKAIIGTMGGLLGGAVMMHINPWIDKAIKPEKPLANFAVEHSGLIVTFVNRSSGGSEGRWDFGDGSPIEILPAKQETVTHTYSRPGSYPVKLALRNLLDEINERTVTVDLLSDGEKSKAVEQPEIADLYVKPPGKHGEPVFAPATFQFQATADNAQMYIWDFGDGKGIQMGDDHIAYTFNQPGTYPVKVTVFNGKKKTVKDTVVQVTAPPTGTLAINVKVADQGTQVETRRREVPVSGAANISPNTPAILERVIAATPGCEIVHVERVTSQNQNVESTSVQIAADKKSAKVTARLAKLGSVSRAVLYEQYAVQEQRKEKATRDSIPLMATVGAPGNTTVRLPTIPADWTDVKRDFVFELRQDNSVLWQGNSLPKNVAVNLNGQTYTLAANIANERMQVNLVGRN